MNLKKLDIQFLLEETVRLAVKDYMDGIDNWEAWERDLEGKDFKTYEDVKKKKRLDNFKTARRFLFGWWIDGILIEQPGLDLWNEIAGYDYLPIFPDEIRRLCSDTDCLMRLFPKNTYLPGQTNVLQNQDECECEEPDEPFVLEDLPQSGQQDTSFCNTDHSV
jgi:hypothetical protein